MRRLIRVIVPYETVLISLAGCSLLTKILKIALQKHLILN